MSVRTLESAIELGDSMSVRTAAMVGVAAVTIVALSGCAAAQPGAGGGSSTPVTSASDGPSANVPATPITFVSVIDGDTIETSEGTVRIIGIDAPESGQCGHEEASAVLASVLAPGNPITLELPAGQNDRDQYERLIRYVITPTGADLGLLQLQAGNAVARYDSTDGYPVHPREAEYRAAQAEIYDWFANRTGNNGDGEGDGLACE